MIRADRFALTTDDFASERRNILDRADERLAEPVRWSLMRIGLPNWEDILVNAALDVFDETARAEVDEWNPIIDDMRSEFERQLRETLLKTKREPDHAGQAEAITRWVSSMAVNGGTEAATTSDPDPSVGLEWVTMSDGAVRQSHQDAHGQVVPTGQPFSVEGYELTYPGEPVGPPSIWINCRCVVAPTKLTEMAQKTTLGRPRVSQEMASEEEKHTSTIIAALPAASDPVNGISSEEDGAHVTLLFFGELEDATALEASLEAYAEIAAPEPFTDTVSGHATLGADEASVALLDGAGVSMVREQLLADEGIKELLENAEQFPVWIPHVTLGYPETPPLTDEIPKEITFDRIALWHGDEQKEYPLGQKKLETESSEDPSMVAASEEEETEETEEVDDAPIIPEEEAYPEVQWHGVLAPEGVPSGDKRMFAENSLTNRDLPLPMKWMPADDEGHKGSVVAARIDRIFREDGLIKGEGVFDYSEHGYESLRQVAEGMIRGVSVDVDSAEAALDADDEELTVFSSARIASATMCAIPAFAEAYIAIGPWEDQEEPEEPEAEAAVSRETFENIPGVHKDGTPPKCDFCDNPSTKYVLHSEGMAYTPACDEHIDDATEAAATSTPDGSRDESNIVRVGEYSHDPKEVLAQYPQLEFAPVPRKTKDGPGWITDPKPTKRITDYWVDGPGAAKISWGAPGDFNRCRTNLAKYVQKPDWLAGLCANLHYRALRAWPGQASGRTEEMSKEEMASMTASVTMVDAEHDTLDADWFRNPEFTGPTPFTVTEEGRVFGHISTFDTCHIGFPDECKTAPHTATNYANFLTGEVYTDAGPIPVGQVTLGGGHADGKLGLKAAVAHYDSTSAAVADIMVGEDDFGTWCAGALRPDVDEGDKRALRAASLSGDWRQVRKTTGESSLEMIAALAVNVPGFPIPRPALVASGHETLSMVAAGIPQDVNIPKIKIDDEAITAALDRRIDEALARRERSARVAGARADVRNFKVQNAKSKMKV